MQRIYALFCLCCSIQVLVIAQTERPWCGFDEMIHREIINNPGYKAELQAYDRLLEQWGRNGEKRSGIVYRIPVVVHVIHKGEAVGSGSNLSEARIRSQVEILNADYRRNNSDAGQTPGVFLDFASDVEIEFCLAKVDPDGNSTSGITRNLYNSIANTDYIDNVIKPNTAWDPLRYLNIWILDMPESRILGYAYLPTTSKFGTVKDGVVIDYNRFGFVDHRNRGRTVTHEIGHYLGLKHPWGSTDNAEGCDSDDGIEDTPACSGPYYGCPRYPQSSCNSDDMFMNFMDYVDDHCMNLFTKGQVSVMRNTLEGKRRGLIDNTEAACLEANCLASYDLRTSKLLMGFEDQEPYGCWKIEDTNRDDNSWGIFADPDNGETGPKSGKNFLAYFWNQDNVTAADDYIFTPYFKLHSDHEYEISYSYSTGQSNGISFSEKFEVGFSFNQSSEDFFTISEDWIFNPAENPFPAYRTVTRLFKSDGEGQVSIGFHVFSAADRYALQIDDIQIVDLGSTVATQDPALAAGYSVFPNPSFGTVRVDIELEAAVSDLSVEIRNIMGRLIVQHQLVRVKSDQLSFDLSNEANGLYFVSLRSAERSATKKLLLVK